MSGQAGRTAPPAGAGGARPGGARSVRTRPARTDGGGGGPAGPLRGRAGGRGAVAGPEGPLRRPRGSGKEDRTGAARRWPGTEHEGREVVDVGDGVVDRGEAERAAAGPGAGLRGGGGADAGPGRGREHGDLHRGGRGAAEAPPLRGAGAPGARVRVGPGRPPPTATTCGPRRSPPTGRGPTSSTASARCTPTGRPARTSRTGDRRSASPSVPVTAGYFETLGVAPLLGRTFREDESTARASRARGRPGATPSRAVAILSHGLWVDRFGGDARRAGPDHPPGRRDRTRSWGSCRKGSRIPSAPARTCGRPRTCASAAATTGATTTCRRWPG